MSFRQPEKYFYQYRDIIIRVTNRYWQKSSTLEVNTPKRTIIKEFPNIEINLSPDEIHKTIKVSLYRRLNDIEEERSFYYQVTPDRQDVIELPSHLFEHQVLECQNDKYLFFSRRGGKCHIVDNKTFETVCTITPFDFPQPFRLSVDRDIAVFRSIKHISIVNLNNMKYHENVQFNTYLRDKSVKYNDFYLLSNVYEQKISSFSKSDHQLMKDIDILSILLQKYGEDSRFHPTCLIDNIIVLRNYELDENSLIFFDYHNTRYLEAEESLIEDLEELTDFVYFLLAEMGNQTLLSTVLSLVVDELNQQVDCLKYLITE